ncbi:MAG: RNA polymerase sigma factor [Actinobacteria bacterium]|nr:MAG: RNA polymerase sigma factor [Actinomycetota bacterium]
MSSEAAAPAGFSRLLSDDRLTRRAVGGDERAFAAIFRRYHQSLYRFCLAIVGNPEDAQDALQNTMMKVLRALPGEERKIDLKPWLYRIAHNESIDLLRRRRETRPLDVEYAAPGYGLAEDAATRERLRRLVADMRELPERQREVLVMRELAGLDFEEIGTALETSGAVARQTLYEARMSLRQMEEGREMSCGAITKALSDGDGRVTRRRDVRAHLRSCAHCRAFRDEIKGREQDLSALSPLPAIAAAGMLQGLVGGSGATGGGLAAALGGGAAKTIATSAAAKGVATVAVVAAVGVGAADRTGVIHLGLPGEGDSNPAKTAPGVAGSHDVGPAQSSAGSHGQGNGADGPARATGTPPASATGEGKGAAHSKGHGEGHGKGHRGLQAPVPPSEHPTGRGHEKQHPEAAAGGQEKAAENKPEAIDPEGGQSETAPKPTHPAPSTHPVKPPAEPPKEAPENPPPAAPEPPQAPQSQSDSQAKATDEGAGASGSHSKAPEKTP